MPVAVLAARALAYCADPAKGFAGRRVLDKLGGSDD